MIHRKARSLMTPAEVMARVAATALTQTAAQQTGPSGSISVPNSDGTRTVIGAVNTTGSTMATHVGDTTPPGVPTGITAWSGDGTVHVAWDGTITGGIPADFDHVTLLANGAAFAALTSAGSATCKDVVAGTTVSVTATAEDDTCLDDGTPAHNVSAACAAVPVVVTDVADGLSTLIRQSDSGIDVGKSVDGSTYDTPVTRMGSDGAFHVLTKALVEVARLGENVIELGKNSIFSTIRLCADHLRIYGKTSFGRNDIWITADKGPDSKTACSVVLGIEDFANKATDDSGVAIQHIVPDRGVPYNRVGLTGNRYYVQEVEMDGSRFLDAFQPVVLYNGGAALSYDTAPGAGTTGAITLSSSAANYKKMTIYFQTDDDAYGSDEVPFPDGKRVGLSSDWYTGGDFYCKTRAILINGTSITTVQAGNAHVNAGTMTADNVIRITRVEGRR